MSERYDEFVKNEGWEAHKLGLPITANPYLVSQEKDHKNWEKGWLNREKQASRAPNK